MWESSGREDGVEDVMNKGVDGNEHDLIIHVSDSDGFEAIVLKL